MRKPWPTVQIRIRGHDEAMLLRGGVILLLAAGLVCLTMFFWYELEGSYYQTSLSRAFDAQQRQGPTERDHRGGDGGQSTSDGERSGAPPREARPELVGRLEIPRIGVEVMVVNGADAASLRRGAGWLPDTAWPGDGNAAIAAHRDTYFRPLRSIRKGDTVLLTTSDAHYSFRVEWTAVVDPGDTAVLEPTGKPALTLITCYPFYYVGNAPQRFIVRATRQQPLQGAAADLFSGRERPASCSFDAKRSPGNFPGAAD
jgi:LPXTG-site transpeptidase (sortase) family protein